MDPKDIVKRYKKDGLTVIWKPGLCAHSAVCAKGLAEVFRPKENPWINMEGASLAAIEAQVLQCPSKALSVEKEGDLGEETREQIREAGMWQDTANFRGIR